MNKTTIAINTKAKESKTPFRLAEFRRLLAISCRHRRTLLLGLSCTVVFAGLHSVSISGAFPVFKILLEDEGLRGWTDRTLAGRRIGAEFDRPSDQPDLAVIKVTSNGLLHRTGVRSSIRLRDTQGRSGFELLHELAYAKTGTEFTLETTPSTNAPDKWASLRIAVDDLNLPWTLLRRGAAFIPGDSKRDRIRTLGFLLGALVTIVIAANAFRYFGEVLIAKAVLRAMMHLRTDLYERTLHLPMSFFAGRSTSDIVGRFIQDIQEVQRGVLTFFSRFVREPLRAVFILALAFALDWRMTLIVGAIAPITALVFWRVGKRVRKSNRKLLRAYGEMIGALSASMQNLRVVKAYTAEKNERERLRQVDSRILWQQIKLARLQAFVSPAMETVAVLAGGTFVVWLATRVIDHEISMSKFAALGVTFSMLFDPLKKLTDVYVRVLRATAGAQRVFHILDQPVETELDRPQTKLKPLRDRIEFEDVSFTYPESSAPALANINLCINKGETIAIVGPNGSGKTTLVSMLLRFFDPDAGRILYDDINIRDAALGSLRRQIGLVTQDAVVFAGTPIENIAYGSRLPDESAVRSAARRAYADEFIRNITDDYCAPLSERGTSLSGGERQRLAIARAIFRDAPILIFDEATSQIDSESELKIQRALQEFARNRTTLIVAHRLSTIQFADRIVVMNEGTITDIGSHAELIERSALYRALCETQLGPSHIHADQTG